MYCSAKTRSGKYCKKRPLVGKKRCRLQGGLSTGPKIEEGKKRAIAAHWKHGRRSKSFVLARKKIWDDLRQKERQMKSEGII